MQENVSFFHLSLMISENTEGAQQNKCRTDTELTPIKMHFLSGDARSQERFQRISNPFYLLHFTIFYLSEIKDLSIRGTNHAVHAADRPRLRFQLPAEELAEVPVVMQILHSRLLHVHPEGPDVQAVHRLPQPRGQFHLVQATPGS